MSKPTMTPGAFLWGVSSQIALFRQSWREYRGFACQCPLYHGKTTNFPGRFGQNLGNSGIFKGQHPRMAPEPGSQRHLPRSQARPGRGRPGQSRPGQARPARTYFSVAKRRAFPVNGAVASATVDRRPSRADSARTWETAAFSRASSQEWRQNPGTSATFPGARPGQAGAGQARAGQARPGQARRGAPRSIFA